MIKRMDENEKRLQDIEKIIIDALMSDIDMMELAEKYLSKEEYQEYQDVYSKVFPRRDF